MYDKDILAKSTGASLGVVAIVGMLFLSTGMAFAAPISGLGGFIISADTVTADEFLLYPGTQAMSGASDTSGNQYPQAVNELDEAEIEGLTLQKNISLDQYSTPLSGTATIVIDTGTSNVTAGSLLLKTPALQADSATFNGFTNYEEPGAASNDDLAGAFRIEANDSVSQTTELSSNSISTSNNRVGLRLDNADIRASYLVTNQIQLNNLGLEVWYDSGDGTAVYGYDANVGDSDSTGSTVQT